MTSCTTRSPIPRHVTFHWERTVHSGMGGSDQWALMNSTVADIYVDRLTNASIEYMYEHFPDFNWLAEGTLRMTLDRFEVPVEPNYLFCFSSSRSFPVEVVDQTPELTAGASAMIHGPNRLFPLAFVRNSKCTLSSQFGRGHGFDSCDYVCPLIRTAEKNAETTIQERIITAAQFMAQKVAFHSITSQFQRISSILDTCILAGGSNANISWTQAFYQYNLLPEDNDQPSTLMEALLPLYLKAQTAYVTSANAGPSNPDSTAPQSADPDSVFITPHSSNYYLYYLRFHRDLAIACATSEVSPLQGALTIDPYHFHRFPFLTTSKDDRVVDRYMQTSTCWETTEK